MVRAFTTPKTESGMSHDDQTTITGEVTDIFAHRFVVKTATGTVLADIGPKGAEQVRLKKGERVELAGEMKPSELKVWSIAKDAVAAAVVARVEQDATANAVADLAPLHGARARVGRG